MTAQRGRPADMADPSAPVPNLAVLIPNLAALNSLLSKFFALKVARCNSERAKAFTMTKETMANAKKQALLLRNRHIARKSSLVIVSPKIIRFNDEGALQRKTA